MIRLYNIRDMLRKTIMILVWCRCCLAASAQTDLESLKEKYTVNKRDIKVVKEYVEALEDAEKGKRGRTGDKGIYVSVSGVAGGR